MRKQAASDFFRIRRKPVSCDETFPLNAGGIESCSELLEALLQELDEERQNRIRIRFSFEESLLRLRERFGEKNTFQLKVGSWLGRAFIQIELEGDVYNPLSKTEAELEDWSGSLLTSVGLSPLYSYSKGKNILRLNLARKGMNAALKILIAAAVGVLAGWLLRVALPAETQLALVDRLFTPLYDFWVRILSVLSGPVVFLMVCTSILNTRTIEEEGGSSKRVVMRYFLFSLFAAVIAVLASSAFLSEPLIGGKALGINAAEYFEHILNIMPENAIAPMMQSNTPQILLLAFVLGNGIAILDSGAEGLNRLVRQGNAVGLLMTEGVSRCVPFFAALLICMENLSGSLVTFGGMWWMLVLSVLVSAVVILGVGLLVSLSKKVSLGVLMKKLRPAFVTAVRTGSLNAGFGQMERACINRLGMEKHFATVSLPYGLVLYMPVNVIGTLMFTVFVAMRFQIEITVGWMLTAMVLAVVLFVATPPVPGANLLAYIMIFSQLHIPSAALIDAMIFDILFGIFASAANQTLLQMELIFQADRIALLDKDKLRMTSEPAEAQEI